MIKRSASRLTGSLAIISGVFVLLVSTTGCFKEAAIPVESPTALTTSGPATTKITISAPAVATQTPAATTIPVEPLPSTTITPEPEQAPVSNLNYIIVDTGQVKCYDNAREITPPQSGQPFYGQDAQYQGNQPAYRDNGDGTVTDLNTGLMWQRDPGEQVTYQQAISGASSLNLAGYDDWRLPTIKELYSLILFSGTDPSGPEVTNPVPFIDTDYFDFEYGDTGAGDRLIDAQYWSSTQYVSTTMNGAVTIFGVNFADGRIKGYPRDLGRLGQTATHFVRYVRGNPDYGVNNFIDSGDGTITDAATGLMWSKADSGEGMDWEDSLAWVQQRNAENYLGYSDWRLPNAKELESIVDYTRSPATTNSPAVDPVFETTSIIDERGETDYPFFWTGTTHADAAGTGHYAVYVAFGEALGYMNNMWMDVHGAGAQRSDPKTGDPAEYPQGHGPQGDAIRINNYVRCVRHE
jgi:hypothetical protein